MDDPMKMSAENSFFTGFLSMDGPMAETSKGNLVLILSLFMNGPTAEVSTE